MQYRYLVTYIYFIDQLDFQTESSTALIALCSFTHCVVLLWLSALLQMTDDDAFSVILT